jgi:WD40 repeat protein
MELDHMTALPIVDDEDRATGIPQTRYRAFLSYSHALDSRATAHIQDAVQTFAKPWFKPRAFRVFRDQTNLGANPELWPTIQQALDESAFLILVASPAAARSDWIAKELRYWLAKNPPQRLLIVMTAGEIVWDEGAGDFDWTRTTALPRTLNGCFTWQPLYVDLTWLERDPAQATLRNPRFLDAIHTLAAPLYGLEKDQIASRYARQRLQAVIAVATGIVLVLAGAVASVIFAFLYRSESQQAQRERDVAVARLLTARAARFLEPSRNTLEVAALLGASALELESRLDGQTGETVNTLQRATTLLAPRMAQVGGMKDPFYGMLIPGPDAASVVSVRTDGSVCTFLLPALTSNHCLTVGGSPSLISLAAPDRLTVAGSDPGYVELYDWRRKELIAPRIDLDWRFPRNLAFDARGTRLLASGGITGYLIDTASGAVLATATDRPTRRRVQNEHLLVDSRDRFIATTSGGDIILWTVPSAKQPPTLTATKRLQHRIVIGGLAQSPDGKYLAAASGAELWLWDTGTWESRLVTTHPDTIVDAQFSPDDSYIASGSRDGTVHVVHVRSAHLAATARHFASIRSIRFSPDSESFVTASADRTARVWRSVNGQELKRLIHTEPVEAAVPTSDGKYVVTLDRAGNLSSWDLSRLAEGFYFDGGEVDAFFAIGSDIIYTNWGHVYRTTLANMADRQEIAHFGLRTPGRRGVAVSVAARRAALVAHVVRPNSSTVDYFVKVVETDTGKVVFERSMPGSSAVALSGDARLVAAAATEQISSGRRVGANSLAVWDTESGRIVFQQGHAGGEVAQLAMSAKHSALAVVSVPPALTAKASLTLWDVEASKVTRVLQSGGRRASVVFLESASLVAAAMEGKSLLLMDARTGQPRGLLDHDSAVVDVQKSPDETRLVTTTEKNELWIWSVTQRQLERKIVLDSAPTTIAFASDSALLAFGTALGSASIYDLSAGAERWQASLPARLGVLGFSADGSTLFSAYRERLNNPVVSTIRLWRWQGKDLLTEACALIRRDLSDDEWNVYVGTGHRPPLCRH